MRPVLSGRARLRICLAFVLAVALLMMSGCSPAEWVARRRVGGAVARVATQLTPTDGEAVLATVRELSAPLYEGRQAGSDGGRKAADYIAAQFRELGLQPLSGDSYFQEFSIPYTHPAKAPVVTVYGLDDKPQSLTYGSDVAYSVYSDSAAIVKAPVALLTSWPVTSPAGVHGKAVMLLPNREFTDLTYVAAFTGLKEAGAVCVIVAGLPADQIKDLWANEDIVAGIAALGLSERGADLALLASGKTYTAWRQEYENTTSGKLPSVVDTGATISVSWPIDSTPHTARNVVGLLPGRVGSAGPTVLLTAHYDHLGAVPDGPYWPGAWDNASGVAVVLATARALGAIQPELNVIVAAWDAEERGLVGSAEFAGRLPLPISQLAAVLNFDCVGCKDALSVERTPSGPLTARLLAAAAAFKLQTETSEVKPWSDAASFTSLRDDSRAIECIQVFDAGNPYEVPFLHSVDDTTIHLKADCLGRLVDAATAAILTLTADAVER